MREGKEGAYSRGVGGRLFKGDGGGAYFKFWLIEGALFEEGVYSRGR